MNIIRIIEYHIKIDSDVESFRDELELFIRPSCMYTQIYDRPFYSHS